MLHNPTIHTWVVTNDVHQHRMDVVCFACHFWWLLLRQRTCCCLCFIHIDLEATPHHQELIHHRLQECLLVFWRWTWDDAGQVHQPKQHAHLLWQVVQRHTQRRHAVWFNMFAAVWAEPICCQTQEKAEAMLTKFWVRSLYRVPDLAIKNVCY